MLDEKVEIAMEKVEELPKQLEGTGHQVRSFFAKVTLIKPYKPGRVILEPTPTSNQPKVEQNFGN